MLSRRGNYIAALVGIAAVLGTVAWTLRGAPAAIGDDPDRRAAAERSFAETLKSAQGADSSAEYRVASLYAHGNGVETNKKEAYKWLLRAAEHGNVEAQYELGKALREGAGVLQDYALAAKWLELAANNGSAEAQYALGEMYRRGIGVPADNEKAYVWFNLAAAQDVAGAAVQRDAALRALSPAQVFEAQAEARRMSQSTASESGANH